MSKYMVLEIGKSCQTEFKNKESSDFDSSDDAVLIDTVEANSKQEAIDKIINSNDENLRWRKFDDLVAHRIVDKELIDQIESAISHLEDISKKLK